MSRLAAVVLGVLLMGLAAAAGPAGAAPLAKDPKRCNGLARLCDRTLDRVVLAGAHNAMSSADLGWKIPNQTLDIGGQLELGVRALLLDAHYGRRQPDGSVATDDDGKAPPGPRGTYLCHVACQIGATPLAEGFGVIRRFVKANPDDVLVLVVEDAIPPAAIVEAMRASGLTRSVYRGSMRRWPTLRRMIRTRQQVVVLAERQGGGRAAPWYRKAYDGVLQETPYTFKTPDLLTDPANLDASCSPNRGGRRGSLFLMNHWSPDVPPETPDLAASAAVNEAIPARFAACARLRGKRPTIVAADQVTAGDDALIREVRRLNGAR